MTDDKRPSYRDAYEAFDLQRALDDTFGAGAQTFNAAWICCDRHCGAGRVALRWQNASGKAASMTFEELRERSSRFANVLWDLGVEPGDRVAGLLPRVPELLVTIIAAWRMGAVYQPLFTAFGPKAIESRLQASGAKVVVTDAGNRAKLEEAGVGARVITVERGGEGLAAGELGFEALSGAASDNFAPVDRGPDDPFLMMFTSGTTGAAKPLIVPLRAIAAFRGYMLDAVDLRADDVFWNIADPGWAYGLYYAVTGPLALGHTTHFLDAPFTVDSTVDFIQRHGITNLAGAPTAFRLLIAAGPEAVAPIMGKLRVVSSAGEPLNPEVIRWFADHLASPIHDHYGQTELGMVVCNHHGLRHPVRMGAAGYAVPGHRVVVLDEAGQELSPGQPGILSVDRQKSPLFWFAGYEGQATPMMDARYYRSGDTVELNDDGSLSFVGRADDVITSSGYRIGPFEVESALLEHPAVVEAAVIGKPDPERTELVKAFVVLQQGWTASAELASALQRHVRKRLSAHAYPREVEFVEALPKTPSGKVQRFLLRNQEIAKARAADDGR